MHILRIRCLTCLLYGAWMGFWAVLLGSRSGWTWPYIADAASHMAIARNVVEHGVWGLLPHQFSSSTSSPLYTFLVTVLFFLTPRVIWLWVPWALNTLAGLVFLWYLRRREGLSEPFLFLLMLTVPLPLLGFMGMEFSFALLLAWVVARESVQPSPRWWVWALGVLTPLLRYEFLFLMEGIALVWWRTGEKKQAAMWSIGVWAGGSRMGSGTFRMDGPFSRCPCGFIARLPSVFPRGMGGLDFSQIAGQHPSRYGNSCAAGGGMVGSFSWERATTGGMGGAVCGGFGALPVCTNRGDVVL